jgi:hypothetical protein
MEYNSKYKEVLDPNYYNGRINLVTQPDTDILFKMQEVVDYENKVSPFPEAIKGDLECNILAKVFFSQENIQYLQDKMRVGVLEMSKNTIAVPEQNVNNLKIIMRKVYFQYANHRDDTKSEITKLDELILKSIIPEVYNAAVSYKKFQRDVSKLPTPMERAKPVDRDHKHLEMDSFVLNDIY